MSDEEQQTVVKEITAQKKTSPWCAIWVVLFLLLFGVFGILGFTKWTQLNQQLRELKEVINSETKSSAERLKPVDDKLSELNTMQASLQKELQEQSTTLASFKEAASGNVDRWYVAEARYLVKVAQLEALTSANYLLVNGNLEKAQEVLQKVADPKAVEMRAALKQDQEAVLRAASTIDISTLFQKLVELDKQIDALPFPLQTLQPVTLPASADIAHPMSKAWWDRGLTESWRLLKEVVVVKKNTDNHLPFMLPDDKTLLQANLHLQIQHAMDALLRNQSNIYSLSLQQAIDWVTKYFKADDALTVAWLKDVTALKQVDLSKAQLDVSKTVPLFDAYLNQ